MGAGRTSRNGRRYRVTSETVNLLAMGTEDLQHMPESYAWASEFALPDCEHSPTCVPERAPSASISLDIVSELRLPELCAGFGGCSVTAALVAMPETTMDKYTGPESGEYNVRASRKVPAMKPKSVTVGMEEATYDHLRSCVLSLDTGHHARSGCRVNDIHSSPFTAA